VGVHTPYDVLVGAACALLLVICFKPIVMGNSEKAILILLAVLMASGVGYLLYVECCSFPADFDAHNLTSATNNAYTMMGSLTGAALVYLLERRYVNFSTRACWWAQILKVVLGLALVLAVKEGLRSPLEALCGEGGIYTARAIRYFLIVVVAGAVWPMTFRWFGRMGEKK
jgi:hypothetical protein